MNTTVVLTELEKDALVREMEDVLHDAGYDNYDNSALRKIVSHWFDAKKDLITIMQNHPNYNGKYQIVFSESYERSINRKAIKDFVNFYMQSMNYLKYEGIEYVDEYGKTRAEYGEEYDLARKLWYQNDDMSKNDELYKAMRKIEVMFENTPTYTPESSTKSAVYKHFLRNFVREIETSIMTEEMKANLDAILLPAFPDFKCAVGQKVSRVINKVCKLFKMNNWECVESVYNRENEANEFKRVKPYEREFAKLADALNPLAIVRHTILSVHPVDYLTMSYGNSWHSCHDIRNGGGEWCAGTLSYMLDETSMIFYTVDSDYNGEHMELQKKINRNMFHWGRNKLLQGRVYPQGNDGDDTIYRQCREIVQKVWADSLGIPNLWTNEKGTEACTDVVEVGDGNCAYEDWQCNECCNVSYPGGKGTERNQICMTIGTYPICISCGEEHKEHSSLTCECDYYICENCGRRLYNEDNDVYIIDGDAYCESCCYYCDYCDEYHVGDDYTVIHNTNEHVCERALNHCYDYRYCDRCEEWFDTSSDSGTELENGEWYCEGCSNTHVVLIDNEFYDINDSNVVRLNDGYYLRENTTTCCDCGEVLPKEDMEYLEDSDEYICVHCLRARETDTDNEDSLNDDVEERIGA